MSWPRSPSLGLMRYNQESGQATGLDYNNDGYSNNDQTKYWVLMGISVLGIVFGIDQYQNQYQIPQNPIPGIGNCRSLTIMVT